MDPLPILRLDRLPTAQAPWSLLQRWWQRLCEQIEASIAGINETIAQVVLAQDAADAAQDAAIAAALSASNAQTVADGAVIDAASAQSTADGAVADAATAQADATAALTLAGTSVQQDVGPAWTVATGTASRAAFATYAAPTISASPTQAEVQAVADAVQILSQRVKALIDDLKGNGSLT